MNSYNLPFYFGTTKDNKNNGLPPRYKFNFYYDDKLKLVRQKPNIELIKILGKIYSEGNLADGSIGDDYSNAYLDFIQNLLLKSIKKNDKVFEIGFGDGIVLKNLSDNLKSQNLYGIEPGNHSLVENLEETTLIKDFFPSNKIKLKFDFIYSFCVLEHIEDPILFLDNILDILNYDGSCIIGVPNCEINLKEGDISLFFHEHFSYFTRKSFLEISKILDVNIVDLFTYKGMIFWHFSKKKYKSIQLPQSDIYSKFNFDKYKNLKNKFIELFRKYDSNKVAIYVPSRAINLLSEINIDDVILIDDNKNMQGRYMPFFKFPIRSLESLKLGEIEIIIIFSMTFHEKIFSKCISKFDSNEVKIISLNDFL